MAPGSWPLYVLMFVEGILFTAVGPLLPTLKDELDLSTSQAGLLAAGYVAGAVIGSAPAALLSARLGVKRCTVIGVFLLAAGTVAFGVCGGFSTLLASQLVGGFGAACIWIGVCPWLLAINPPDQRGVVLGVVFGTGAAGEIMGPVVGTIAATAGRAVTFPCIAGLALLVCAAVTRVASPPRGGIALGWSASLNSSAVRAAIGLNSVPPLVWGVVIVLGALDLDRLGASTPVIGAVFIIAAVIAAIEGPFVGRWSDQHGPLPAIRVGFALSIPALAALAWTENRIAVALLVILTTSAVRLALTPLAALLTDACRDVGGSDIAALALWLPVGAAGLAIGSAAGGALAQATSSAATYIATAIGVLVVLLLLDRRRA